jgi:hypothetical protein
MDLQHHCLPSVGEAVDQGHPPQRPAPVQALGGQLGTGGVEFLRSTRLREDRVTEVICEVKAGVRNKHGMSQAQGEGNDSPPECRELIEPCGEVAVQVLKGDVAAGVRAEHSEGDALHRLVGHLQAE